MKIVGTIVNKDMTLQGLLLKGRPSEFGNSMGKEYMMAPYKLSEVKSLIKEDKIKDYKINEKGNIEGINKKLSDLPMYDNKGNFLDKRMEIRSIIEDSGNLVGAVVYFPLIGKEKKLKIDDLSLLYEYFEPINFGLRERDNKYYITGKGETKKEDIPVIKKSSSNATKPIESDIKNKIKCTPGYSPFIITEENRDILDYSAIEYNEGVDVEEYFIPKRIIYKGKKYEVVGIDKNAFRDWETISLINEKCVCFNISNTVVYIGDSAFRGSYNLNMITFLNSPNSPNSLISIGENAFANSAICEIVIPNSVTFIGKGAFSYCDSLGFVQLPNTIKSIEDSLFFECEHLWSVEIPNSVTSIGNFAFFNCNYLPSIDIPNSVTSIGEFAFDICSRLKDIKIPDNVTYIGGGAFIGCDNIDSIVIPDKVNFIGSSAFSSCKKLTSIVLPKSLVRLGNEKFYEDYGDEYGRGIFEGSPLKYIYYKGSKAEWDKIEKISGWSNGLPKDCEIIYNYGG